MILVIMMIQHISFNDNNWCEMNKTAGNNVFDRCPSILYPAGFEYYSFMFQLSFEIVYLSVADRTNDPVLGRGYGSVSNILWSR